MDFTKLLPETDTDIDFTLEAKLELLSVLTNFSVHLTETNTNFNLTTKDENNNTIFSLDFPTTDINYIIDNILESSFEIHINILLENFPEDLFQQEKIQIKTFLENKLNQINSQLFAIDDYINEIVTRKTFAAKYISEIFYKKFTEICQQKNITIFKVSLPINNN